MSEHLSVADRSLFIGDNLDALRSMASSYVDLIYMPPPGNTGRRYSASKYAKARGVTFNDVWTTANIYGEWLEDIGAHYRDAYSAIMNTMSDKSMMAYLTYMAIRLVEVRRIIKPAGSVYLHSNPEVAPYLRTVMDRMFGRQNFRNEIIWKRPARRTGDRRWLPIHDTILFYTGGRARTRRNPVPQVQFADYWIRNYRLEDEYGRFHAVVLINKGLRGGDLGDEWRGIWPARNGDHWSVSLKALRSAYPAREDLDELSIQEKLDLLDEAGLIYWPRRGNMPRRRHNGR